MTDERDKPPYGFERGKAGTNARTEAEAEIEKLRQRGGLFVEAVARTRMPMAVTDARLPGNPIVFANDAFLRLSGYSMTEVLGQRPHFLNGPDTDPRDAARFREALRRGEDIVVESFQYRKDGTRFFAAVFVSPVADEDGQVIQHFLSYFDITRRVEAEAEIRGHAAALEEEVARRTRSLAESEGRLAAAFGSVPAGVAVIDVAGNVILSNAEFRRFVPTGIIPSRDPDRGRRWKGWHEDGQPLAPKDFPDARALRGESVIPGHEMLYTDDEGREIWTNIATAPTFDDEGRVSGAVTTIGDIDARKRSAEALRLSEERLRDVLNAMAEGFALLSSDFRILDINDETERLDGRPRDELVGQSHWDAFPGTEQSPVGQLFREVIRTGRPGLLEHRFVWPGGRALWLDMRAYPTPGGGLAIFWRDITDRKAAADALRESEERYRTLFESMDEAYAVVEVLKDADGMWSDFRFLEVNPAFLAHTSMPHPVGKTATEILGTPNPRWAQLYGQVLDTGEMLRIEETEHTLGRTFDLNIFGLDRARNRVAVLFTDISGRKRSEEHQRILLAELQHRVRNTLGVVRSIARRTAQNSESVEEMRAHLEGRLDAFARVQAVVTRRPDAGVDLASLIEDELVAYAAREGEAVRLNGPDVAFLPRPAETLSLAIHELTTNAVKYGALSAEAGRIRVDWTLTNGRFELVWIESGVRPPPEGPGREGFGLELLRRVVPYELSAETAVDFLPDGLRFTLSMPAEGNIRSG